VFGHAVVGEHLSVPPQDTAHSLSVMVIARSQADCMDPVDRPCMSLIKHRIHIVFSLPSLHSLSSPLSHIL
jgi:hypothetical protein